MYGIPNLLLVTALLIVFGGAIAAGVATGARLRERRAGDREPVGVVQGALLGLIGLLLAFGLSMAVSRYEHRRTVLVAEANDLGTTHLRAQLLAEPQRSTSLALLVRYADASIAMAEAVVDSDAFDRAAAEKESLQRELWAAAGEAVAADPTGTGPRVYVDTLNEMIDRHTDRVASLRNRVPSSVVALEVIGSAVAVGVLALHLTMLGRGLITSVIAGLVVVMILFVSIDLDRPRRGFIVVPSAALVDVRTAMDDPPAYGG